jgi:hypothetical protein
MGRDMFIMLLGIWIAILPFLGFPGSWDRIFFLISGIILISIGISLRRSKNSNGIEMKKELRIEQHAGESS